MSAASSLYAVLPAVPASAASLPVTDWPLRLALTALTLAVAVGIAALMLRGWRRRAARQSGVPALPDVPQSLEAPLCPPAGGVYVCTTTEGDWLDRVVVHGLRVRSSAELTVDRAGLRLERVGAADLFIPAADVRGVRRAGGMAGKFVGGNGLLVVTWRLGAHHLDTGFKPHSAARIEELEAAVSRLLGERTPSS